MGYQRKLGRELRRRFPNVREDWINFCDANGPGWAQPDFFVVRENSVLCFEAKLTQQDAWGQLQLYRSLLFHIFRRPILCILVCKYVKAVPLGGFILAPEDLPEGQELNCTWHWLG